VPSADSAVRYRSLFPLIIDERLLLPVLRNQQMEAFADDMMRRYQKRAAAHLRERFNPELANIDDGQLNGMIEAGMKRAAGYGITAEADVTRFLEYTVEFGPEFDTNPTNAGWAQPILTDANLTGTAKMNRLDDYTTFELRRR
jgi:hypothetical protein